MTRELSPAQLAALAAESKAPNHDEPVAVGRAATLNDPLTTSLLAEVARQSQTQEFDDDLIEEMKEIFDETKPKPGERKSG